MSFREWSDFEAVFGTHQEVAFQVVNQQTVPFTEEMGVFAPDYPQGFCLDQSIFLGFHCDHG